MTATAWRSGAKGTGQYADVNGLHLYYETHGQGRPMILLHGGLASGETFGPIIPALSADHTVIAPDLQGHGRTADIDRPIDARLMADDIAALIGHLGLDHPDVVGYSLGGGVAFWTAVKHPEVVGRMVMVSANTRRDAIYPEMLAQQGNMSAASAEFMKERRCTSSTRVSRPTPRTSRSCSTRWARRWRRTSTSMMRSAG
jgi:pimeloyl-ACP methyl ester carboxylesterase